jgi:uncharacterized phage protein (TIGR02220 family)
MGKDPAFMLYSQDFLVGVSDLTMEERGQYITMLCLQHQKGHLTKKNIQIAVGNVSEDVMSKFIQDENEMYYNETLEVVIQKREAYSQSRSENGKKGGRPKKEALKNHTENQEKTICLPYAKAYENHSENENENINVIKDIIEYLNNKLGTRYKYTTKDIQSHIKARLKEGFTYEDFVCVIDKKYKEWHGTKWEEYLRPITLFSTKFQSYLNQKGATNEANSGDNGRSDKQKLGIYI